MPRLSIDITPEQHQHLKAIAALSGKTIKDYILDCSLKNLPDIGHLSEDEALRQLKHYLTPRLVSAEKQDFSDKSFSRIKEECKAEIGSK